jgi:hypothetical protein
MNYIPCQMLTQVMKARWVKWAEHVASMGERRNAYAVWVKKT